MLIHIYNLFETIPNVFVEIIFFCARGSEVARVYCTTYGPAAAPLDDLRNAAFDGKVAVLKYPARGSSKIRIKKLNSIYIKFIKS